MERNLYSYYNQIEWQTGSVVSGSSWTSIPEACFGFVTREPCGEMEMSSELRRPRVPSTAESETSSACLQARVSAAARLLAQAFSPRRPCAAVGRPKCRSGLRREPTAATELAGCGLYLTGCSGWAVWVGTDWAVVRGLAGCNTEMVVVVRIRPSIFSWRRQFM
jgi:hypothetical protein